MSATAATASEPEFTGTEGARGKSERAGARMLVVAALALLCLAGFGLRAYRLGAESLSEDELNKVRAVAEYRADGLTPANGEHPFLMKGLMTASFVAAEAWNSTAWAAGDAGLRVSNEAAARLPVALFGALTSLVIFLVARELFGSEVGMLAAALWALDPTAVGFNRIAKEDSFLVFFFLLANVFWLRGRREAEGGHPRPEPYYWATAVCFGAMMASKYMPHLISISGAFYYAFVGIETTRWHMGKRKWLVFFAVMGLAFVIFNPTILLPGTWHEMKVFAGENRIGHDAYEYLGRLYRNQMTLWLNGSPWHFYYVFMGVKLPLAVLAGFVAGLPLLFSRRLGDGRFFIIFYLYFWFLPFTVLGGKFTRYFTFPLPAVLIISALGLLALSGLLARGAGRLGLDGARAGYARAVFALVVLSLSAYASASAAPHYRLYTNALGGGSERAGTYFPHDEFYDSATRETVASFAGVAPRGARVASETPELVAHYAREAGRPDLVCVSLSDPQAVGSLGAGDVVIVARGRRYFSNDRITRGLPERLRPHARVNLGAVLATEVFLLDEPAAAFVRGDVARAQSNS
ncbi:MAG TPA: glycosyltransferase family 39 protein [Pyrinomonadaceae bacterium]|nr:glycosyltransferase family 39 protein [Pyrinomonadaceae bacterium]